MSAQLVFATAWSVVLALGFYYIGQARAAFLAGEQDRARSLADSERRWRDATMRRQDLFAKDLIELQFEMAQLRKEASK